MTEKIKNLYSLSLTDQQCAGISGPTLNEALEIFAKLALNLTLEKVDKLSHVPRIPFEDCNLVIDPPNKSVMLTIIFSPEYAQELAEAVAAVYQDLQRRINLYGINFFIEVGRKALG